MALRIPGVNQNLKRGLSVKVGDVWLLLGLSTGILVNEVITEAPRSNLSEKMSYMRGEQQGAGQTGKMEAPRVSESNRPLDAPPPRSKSSPLLHYWKGGGVVCVLLGGGDGQEQNGSAVAWQRYLPVTITLSSSLPSHEDPLPALSQPLLSSWT